MMWHVFITNQISSHFLVEQKLQKNRNFEIRNKNHQVAAPSQFHKKTRGEACSRPQQPRQLHQCTMTASTMTTRNIVQK